MKGQQITIPALDIDTSNRMIQEIMRQVYKPDRCKVIGLWCNGIDLLVQVDASTSDGFSNDPEWSTVWFSVDGSSYFSVGNFSGAVKEYTRLLLSTYGVEIENI
jgi:hypothetical protein